MPHTPPQYQQIADSLSEFMLGQQPRIVAITGPMRSGKTTLGRYLAWNFNVSLVETDLLLFGCAPWRHDLAALQQMIDICLGMDRPVFVEGLTSLRLLKSIGKTPDFVIELLGDGLSGSGPFGEQSVELDTATIEASGIRVAIEHSNA